GVVRTGPQTYMVSRQAASGFTGMGTLKADAMREANAYCAKQGRVADLISTHESPPPYILGNFPQVEIEFGCAPAAGESAH
ncbi:MAG: hypothetical protein WBV61_01380, partial [Rhodanobacteraceae bacterium]